MLSNAIELTQRLLAEGGQEIAESVQRAAAGAFQGNIQAWFGLAVQLQEAGETEAAIDAYRAVLEINYEEAATHQNMAGLLSNIGRYGSALSSYKMVLKHHPEWVEIHLGVAETAWRAGRPRDAMALLETSIAAGINVPRCLDLKGRLMLQAKQFDEVIRLAEASWPIVETEQWAQHAMTNAYDSALYAIGRGAEGPFSGKYPDVTLEGVRGAWRQLEQACPRFAALLPIHVIGDSHSTFFTGLNYHQFCSVGAPQMLPQFKSYNIGGKLAFTLDKGTGRHGRGGPFLELLASGQIPSGAAVMMSFGEINTRVHVLKQAEKQGRSVEEIQQEVVDVYVATIDEVKALGFRPLVWAPVGGTPDDNPNPHLYPANGSMRERNKARWDFIGRLVEGCAPRNVPVVSMFRAMVDEDMATDASWLLDGLHLNQRAMVPTVSAFYAVLR